MTSVEKAAFIKELCDTTRDTAIARIERMPEAWDGHELRLYLSQLFADNVSSLISQEGRRRREYRNTVLVSNL